uniref:Uncharacterized protein TCIL3000_11_4300 n=1 Tax=Trypanosoma congolense (strain IL3000) TaxID=1068625 RepID=G0V055_TRYCI|nr:unnamed protein product [Trypanosoma congolense IL3000]
MQQPFGLTVQGLHTRSRQERVVQQRVVKRQSSSVSTPSASSSRPATTSAVVLANGEGADVLRCSSSPSPPFASPPPYSGASQETALMAMEGPLPAEVRQIIHSSCSGSDAELAERHARRLLSTGRRVNVYRAELQSAIEEVNDVDQLVKQHQIVQAALRTELSDLDARIEKLMKERQLCEYQLRQQETEAERKMAKLTEANMRVDKLSSTIDSMTHESLAGYVLLQKLVPNLHVNNYLT